MDGSDDQLRTAQCVYADDVAVRVGDVHGVAASAGERLAVFDVAGVEPGEQYVEVGAGADGEAEGVEPGECGCAYWVLPKGEAQLIAGMAEADAAQPIPLAELQLADEVKCAGVPVTA